MSPAPAEIILHPENDVFSSWTRIFQKKAVGIQNHSWGAKSTLERIMLDKSLLNRMKISILSQTFYRDDLLSVDFL
jgi:hypothetical protein